MKLGQLQVNHGGKFSPESPLLVDFTQSKRVNEKGDNGTGKTTAMELLLVAIGQLSGKEIYDKLVNAYTNKLEIELPFVGTDRLSYISKVTKSGLKLIYEGESLPSPLTKLKQLIGVAGVSPMEIKNRPVGEIIKWLASYSKKSPEEYEELMAKAKVKIRDARNNRAASNRVVKSLREYLQSEELYNKWEESEKKYAKSVDIKDLSKKLDEAGKKSDKYIRAEEKLKQLNADRPEIVSEIEALKIELAAKEKELVELDDSIEKGKKYIDENKADKKEYDVVKKQYDEAAGEVIKFNKWQEIQTKKKEMDSEETKAQKYDADEKEMLAKVAEAQAEILPTIKGLQLVLEDTHEDGGEVKKEGLYLGKINTAKMSETEWWDIVMQIWIKNKVKLVVIDNAQSLGSNAMARLDQLEKIGCYIFTAEMARETKVLEIEYQ